MKTIKEDKTRKITVYSHIQHRKDSGSCEVPYIRLRGKWLMDAGFQVGNPIKIAVTENGLIITINKESNTSHR